VEKESNEAKLNMIWWCM